MGASQTGHAATTQVAAFGFRFPRFSARGVDSTGFVSSPALHVAHVGDLEKWTLFASTPQSGFPSCRLACFPLTLFFFFFKVPASDARTDRHCEQVAGSENRGS